MKLGSRQRKQYYIDKRFQTGFILKFIAVLGIGAVLSVIITMVSTQATLTSTFDGARLVIEKTSLAILPSVVFTSLITTCILGVIVVVVTLFVSHKIAGPMYRFEKDLEEIAQGNLQKKVNIRAGDQFVSVAKNLNDMVAGLNGKLQILQAELDSTISLAEDEGVSQTVIDRIKECRDSVESNFKL